MKKTILVASIASLFLAGCIPAVVEQPILSSYDRGEISWSLKKGSGIIEGNGFLRRNDGMLVKCAGQEVSLVAAGTYATERFTKLYGNYLGGYNKYRDVEDAQAGYNQDMKITICDVDGKFEFKDVAAGKYYVATYVGWLIANQWQGGNLSKLIEVKEGETLKVILSQ